MKWRNTLLSLGMVASGIDGDTSGCDCGSQPVKPGAAYTIKVVGVSLADDDGSNATVMTREQFQASLDEASEIYQRSGANLTFVASDDSNFGNPVKRTLLNHDCKPMTNNPGQYTDPDKDKNDICDEDAVADARAEYADQFEDAIVIFLRYASDGAEYKDGKWTIVFRKATGGFSGGNMHFVVGVGWGGRSTFLAHEMGHFLHLPHTFTKLAPKSLQEASVQVQAAMAANLSNPLMIYDGDADNGIFDTPPDPRGALWTAVHGDACATDESVTITAGGKDFVAKPDRANVMSYFKGCPWDMHITDDQAFKVYDALLNGNRQRLIEGQTGANTAGTLLIDAPTTEPCDLDL